MSRQKIPYLTQVIDAIRKDTPEVTIEGLRGPGECLFLSLVNLEIGKNCLFIIPTPSEAEVYYSDLAFFSPDRPVYLYPTREILPYEELEPDPLLISQRIRGLQALVYLNDNN